MALKYYFRVGDVRGGSTILPVTGDPTYTINEMDTSYSIGNCALVFFDGNGDPVTPTGGTIQFESSAIDDQWLDPPSEATINATDVVAGPTNVATYTLPSFDGPVAATRMILTGITGAVSVQAYHWRANA